MGGGLGEMFPSWEAELLVPPHMMIQWLAGAAAATAADVSFLGKAAIALEVIACQEHKMDTFIMLD